MQKINTVTSAGVQTTVLIRVTGALSAAAAAWLDADIITR